MLKLIITIKYNIFIYFMKKFSIALSIFLIFGLVSPAYAQILSVEAVSVSTDEVLGNGSSISINMTSDGRYIVFTSEATNLVPGDTNGVSDIFVRDRVLGTTEIVSVSSDEELGNGATGRHILPVHPGLGHHLCQCAHDQPGIVTDREPGHNMRHGQ